MLDSVRTIINLFHTKSGDFYKEHKEKKLHQVWLKNKCSTPLFDTFKPYFLLLLCTADQHKLYKKNIQGSSYHVWFQLAQWFQRRRLKTDKAHFDTFGPLISFV